MRCACSGRSLEDLGPMHSENRKANLGSHPSYEQKCLRSSCLEQLSTSHRKKRTHYYILTLHQEEVHMVIMDLGRRIIHTWDVAPTQISITKKSRMSVGPIAGRLCSRSTQWWECPAGWALKSSWVYCNAGIDGRRNLAFMSRSNRRSQCRPMGLCNKALSS